MRGTFSVSWGPSGGFYWTRGAGVSRLCLGPVALTFVRNIEIDDLLAAWVEREERV